MFGRARHSMCETYNKAICTKTLSDCLPKRDKDINRRMGTLIKALKKADNSMEKTLLEALYI